MTKFINILTSAATLAMAAMPLIAIGSTAHAAEARIQVADLNFANPADAQRFAQRVDVAANSICRELAVPGSMTACRQAVREEAVEKLGGAQRQALAATQGGVKQLAGL